MQDRVSRYPGRIKLIPVDKNKGIYDVVRADEPTQEGTPLNTANLFSSATSQDILTNTLDLYKSGTSLPDTVDLGIRRICEHYGASELAGWCDFSFMGDAAGKARVVDASIKYLASLGTVFVNISFEITDETYSTSYILIKAESMDQLVGDIFEHLYGFVPMISTIPETSSRPSMSNQGEDNLYIEILSSGGINAARNVMTVVGMYQCRTSFTIKDGSTVPDRRAVSPGTTWKMWVGTSRVINESSGLTLYASASGPVFANEAGSKALGLNGKAVLGSDTIRNGATYTIISYGG